MYYYYYNKNSREKVVHTEKCYHIKNIENFNKFKSLGGAHRQGFRLCMHCNHVLKYFKRERKYIGEYCKTHGMIFEVKSDHILITSVFDSWILSPTYKGKRVALFHENKFNTECDELPIYDGYHSQMKTFHNISKALKYIYCHDKFRNENPLYIKPTPKAPPRKGSKRYKSAQRQAKETERNESISNVFSILETLKIKNDSDIRE